MSWSGYLPFWVLQVEYEEFLALCSCGMSSEIDAGFLKGLPEHVIEMIIRKREDESIY